MRLRDIREDEDLTQKEMADILKTTQANYSRWENGSEMVLEYLLGHEILHSVI